MMLAMTEEEICRAFNEAKDPRLQIGILADLNVCRKEKIIKILILNGQDISKAVPKKSRAKRDSIQQMIYSLLDEVEEEIRAAERKYIQIVEGMKQYAEEKAKA